MSVVADQNRALICEVATKRRCRGLVVVHDTIALFGMTLSNVADGLRWAHQVRHVPLQVGA